MESLQLSQVLADLSNLGAAEPEAAAAIVSANGPSKPSHTRTEATTSAPASTSTTHHQRRPSGLQRNWSSEGKFDKFGRRILSPGSRSGNSTPGTPRRGESDVRRLHYQSPPRRSWELGTDQAAIQFEDDVDRASTLMALYDIRSKIKQQDNSSLLKAREKINALAARQQAQQAAERNMKAADELRRQRYSFPRAGL
ncbi:pyruvate carboxylase [Fusarium albosuccineum]|uniref:Pyruvate carboxylase n=1 Tax=Fusarium albosuccineum TaxID=1237068 RepID=A0A8H4L6C7_9HYPO|nr:pyruvate carboxylase [Fusarium albosuccineum]